MKSTNLPPAQAARQPLNCVEPGNLAHGFEAVAAMPRGLTFSQMAVRQGMSSLSAMTRRPSISRLGRRHSPV